MDLIPNSKHEPEMQSVSAASLFAPLYERGADGKTRAFRAVDIAPGAMIAPRRGPGAGEEPEDAEQDFPVLLIDAPRGTDPA